MTNSYHVSFLNNDEHSHPFLPDWVASYNLNVEGLDSYEDALQSIEKDVENYNAMSGFGHYVVHKTPVCLLLIGVNEDMYYVRGEYVISKGFDEGYCNESRRLY